MSEEHDDFFNVVPTTEKESTMTIEARLDKIIELLGVIAAGGGKIIPAAAGKAAPAAPKEDGKLDYERDLKPLALEVAQKKGRDALVAINEKFKVEHAGKLTPAQWADYIKACKEALAPALA